MADFLPAFEAMIQDEGGYVLHNVPGDRGGQTYAGIARNFNPDWEGWEYVDRRETPPTPLVRNWYHTNYWVPIGGDHIISQAIASSIFNFAVNSSAPGRPAVAIKLAQLVVGATPDGSIGPRTLQALNAYDPEKFVMAYALAKIARYRDIVTRDRTQLKFMLGWVNRTLAGVNT
jgi:lysozyme family protein